VAAARPGLRLSREVTVARAKATRLIRVATKRQTARSRSRLGLSPSRDQAYPSRDRKGAGSLEGVDVDLPILARSIRIRGKQGWKQGRGKIALDTRAVMGVPGIIWGHLRGDGRTGLSTG